MHNICIFKLEFRLCKHDFDSVFVKDSKNEHDWMIQTEKKIVKKEGCSINDSTIYVFYKNVRLSETEVALNNATSLTLNKFEDFSNIDFYIGNRCNSKFDGPYSIETRVSKH